MEINKIFNEQLQQQGFQGFKTITVLQKNDIFLPEKMGVYLILTPENFNKEFLEIGTGGSFKGKNPNVSIDELEYNWVEEANILYIGKAGGSDSDATLFSRIKQYLQFGQNKPVGHWGGRYIWQLKNSGELIVCWKILKDIEPASYESAMIDAFKQTYGKRPFANLKD